MKNCEEQMKHKDEELEKETSGQATLPLVRSENKGKIKKASGKQNGADNKPKRIKSYDYSAWDKFDKDNTCKDVEKEEQSDRTNEQAMCNEALKKSHEVAIRHKNEGNIFVQQQRWAKAIGCFNQAIIAFSYDPELYAKRALCLLKLDYYCSAAADCTIAIRLDETYAEAYCRRAAARVNLKQYKNAIQDLEKVLQLEPLNTEVTLILIQIGNKIKVSESNIMVKENTETSSKTSKIVGEIGEKIWSDTPQSIQIIESRDTDDIKHSKGDERNVKCVKEFKHTKKPKTSDVGDTNNIMKNKDSKPVRLWRHIELNERSCIILLLVMSLSIVLGKLYTNYGDILQLQNSSKYVISPTTVFSCVSNVFDVLCIPGELELDAKQGAAASEKFAIISQWYDAVVNVTTLFYKTYEWLIRAAICGLMMTSFSSFIIYKDSNIPGFDPPFPFSPATQRFSQASGVQLNYLFGVLNGILIFIYMCL